MLGMLWGVHSGPCSVLMSSSVPVKKAFAHEMAAARSLPSGVFVEAPPALVVDSVADRGTNCLLPLQPATPPARTTSSTNQQAARVRIGTSSAAPPPGTTRTLDRVNVAETGETVAG